MDGYKEKYKKALEAAKALCNITTELPLKEYMESIFPELKESEDDRIRKGIIRYLEKSQFGLERYMVDDNIVRDYIAWLEKKSNTDIEQVFRPLAGCDIDIAAKQAVEQQKQGKNVVLAFNGCYIPVKDDTADAIVKKYNAWLEKQNGKSDYNPYKTTVESISAMVEKYAPFDSNLQDFYDNIKVKCKDAIEYDKTFKQGEQTPTWSVEDEINLEGIIDEIKANKNNSPDYDLATYDKFLSWLKSLKDRVQPQPKLFCSEEDYDMVKETIYFINEFQKSNRCKDENDMQNSATCMNWLKSL